MKKIAVLGYGTVGSGVVEVIETNYDSIAKKAGEAIDVKYVLDLRDFPGQPIQEKIVHDINIILEDKEIDIVVEVMGGVEPACTFVKNALYAGKSVVTSNKELVARHGAELLEIAREKNLNFLFEASVGGGIPIIRPLNQSLTADEITEITGILNGTTNFILTKMDKEGSNFDEVLKEAQALGYAERNPAADVEGFDACRKIAILSSLAFGKNVNYEDIYTEGITKISDVDFKYAKELGCSIKLLASSKNVDGNLYAMVSPVMISPEHPLFTVNGVINGIHVNGNMVGDVMFIGAGAGKLPTASAVVSDIIDAAKHTGRSIMSFWSKEKLEIADKASSKKAFFARFAGNPEDKFETIKEIFGDVKLVKVQDVKNEFAIITEVMSEAEFEEAANKAGGMLTRIRMGK